jgi:hypothetical protein
MVMGGGMAPFRIAAKEISPVQVSPTVSVNVPMASIMFPTTVPSWVRVPLASNAPLRVLENVPEYVKFPSGATVPEKFHVPTNPVFCGVVTAVPLKFAPIWLVTVNDKFPKWAPLSPGS